MQFGIGILIKTSMSYGGVYKLQIFSRKKQEDFFQNFLEISKNFSKINFSGEFKPITKFNESEHIFIIGLPRSGSSLVETISSYAYKYHIMIFTCLYEK